MRRKKEALGKGLTQPVAEPTEELRRGEVQFRGLMKASSDAVYRMSPDWSEMRYLHGGDFLADTEGPDITWLQKYIHPDDQAKVMAVIREALRTKSVMEMEHRILRADGTLGWTFSRAIPILDAAGEIVEWFGAASDVTERRRTEEALRKSEEKYRKLVKYAPAAIYEMDVQGTTFLSVNEAMCDILGYSREELLSTPPSNLMDQESRLFFKERIKKKLVGEQINETIEYRIRKKNGEWIDTAINVGEITYTDEKPTRVVVIGYDITERKQIELALRRSEERYRHLVQHAPAGIFEIDFITGRFTEVNDAMCQILGYTRKELLAMTAFNILDDEGKALFASRIRLAESGGLPNEGVEYLVRAKGGRLIWTLLHVTFHRDNDKIVGATVVAHDITQRKRTEEALQRSEALLRAVLENTPDPIFLKDRDSRLLLANPATFAVVGKPAEAVIGKTDAEFYDDTTTGRTIMENDRRIMNSGQMEVVEECVHKPEGVRFYLSTKAPYRDAEGRVIGLIGVSREITERKRTEETLKKAHEELGKRVQERTSELSEAVKKLQIENIQRKRLEETLRDSENQVRFFASECLTAQETERKRVAGELHDSIAASLGALKFEIEKMEEEAKRRDGNPDPLQRLASRVLEINNEVRRIMADLRPSILDDLGILPALNWFCREYEKTYSHISVDKQVEVQEDEVPDSLKTPIFRISQEAMNNIAKYSRASRVNCSLRKEDNGILLTIKDNGQGFDLKTARKGMGLSTMRERAQLSGGSFELESAIGKGTMIRVLWRL